MNILVLVSVLLFIFGIALIIFGLQNVFNKRVDSWFRQRFPTPQIDKELMSPQGRDFVRRHVVGWSFVFYGAVAIFFAVVSFLYR